MQQTQALDAEKNNLQVLASTALGGLIGAVAGGPAQAAGTGAAVALDADKYNRQLHPTEINQLLKLAPGFAKQLADKLGRSVTEGEALVWLTEAAQANVDAIQQNTAANAYSRTGGGAEANDAFMSAKAFINSQSAALGTWVDANGQVQNYFVAKPGTNDFYDPRVYSQYSGSQSYRDFYWQTLGINLQPTNSTDTQGWGQPTLRKTHPVATAYGGVVGRRREQ